MLRRNLPLRLAEEREVEGILLWMQHLSVNGIVGGERPQKWGALFIKIPSVLLRLCDSNLGKKCACSVW